MELHEKLKTARLKTNLSQQQAADKTGVSRQTLSSWENGKTYPDIASLIKLSGLYDISLDELLKEKDETSSYVDYIDKAVALIKNKRKIYKAVEIGVYILSLIIYVNVYYITRSSVISAVIPFVILIISLLIGIDEAWGKKRWFLILFFGISFGLAEQLSYLLYGGYLPNETAPIAIFTFLNPATYSMGAFVSFIGLGIGTLARRFNNKTEDNYEKQ
jgi:transcriptional regulator with XRE-family HTH domain